MKHNFRFTTSFQINIQVGTTNLDFCFYLEMNIKCILFTISLLTLSIAEAKKNKKKSSKIVSTTKEIDSDFEDIEKVSSKDTKIAERDVEKLLEDFKINFEDEEFKKKAQGKENNQYGGRSKKKNNNNNSKKGNKSKRPMSKREQQESYKQFDKELMNLDKKVFGGGKDRRNQNKRKSGNGKDSSHYFKDTSVPVMFRKVIPPRSGQLPKLHFEYAEGGSICRCSCNLKN